MELPEIYEKMKFPEKLINPEEINNLVSYLGGFITDLELEMDELKIKYSFAWEKAKYQVPEQETFEIEDKGKIIRDRELKPLTDKQTEIKMMRDPIYTQLNQTKRKLGELKRYRSDLRDKLNIIMNIKRF